MNDDFIKALGKNFKNKPNRQSTQNMLGVSSVMRIINSVVESKLEMKRLEVAEKIKGNMGERGPRGPEGIGLQGPLGKDGKDGSTPNHKWEGTKLQFELPDGTWGQQVNLLGKSNGNGMKKGGGASHFLLLGDTPTTYSGSALKSVRVNAAGTGLEFAAASGSGDMTKAVYDPTTVSGDAFDMDNMAESATNLILTATERSAITANTAKVTYPSADSTKVGHISVTQAVNLDTMESDIATNNAKLTADTTNVTAAGALMDSELTDIASVKALNQGVATTDGPQFDFIQLNHATDTTISRVAAGVIAIEGVTVPTISSTNTLTNKTLGSGTVLGAELDAGANSIGFTMQTATGDGATTIDWGNGNHFDFTFGAFNETFTFTAPAKSGVYTLSLKQDSEGSRTATFPATVKWAGGSAPTLTTTATTGYDIISFRFDSTNYYAVPSLDFS